MKTIRNLLLILALFKFGALQGQLTSPVHIDAVHYYQITDAITIDGIANETYWSESKSCDVLFNSPYDFGGDADLSGVFKIFCNSYAFYFYSEIQDNEAHIYDGINGNTYQFDNVELFFNIDTSGVSYTGDYSPDAIQLRFNRGYLGGDGFPGFGNGEAGKASGFDNPMLQYAQVENSSSWTLEAEIPWNYIVPSGMLPEDINDYVKTFIGKVIGFDVQLADSDGSDPFYGARDAQMAWDEDGESFDADEDNAWQDVRKFGVLQLLAGAVSEIPVADAGEDQTVNELDIVTLDGSNSIDYQNDELSFFWTAPDNIELTSNTSAITQFEAPQVTSDSSIYFTLIVSDGTNLSEPDTVWVTILDVNLPPTAILGNDTTVSELDSICLDGRLSFDPEGSELSYYWFSPKGISLNDAQSPTPYFYAPEVQKDTTLHFRLIVNDGNSISLSDTMAITVLNVNKIPVAIAGDDVVVTPNNSVVLDGSQSYDDDDDQLTYTWTLLGVGEFDKNDSWRAIYTAPNLTKDEAFKAVLVVSDGKDESLGDTVNILVDYTITEIEETLEHNGINIYPNPANNYFVISIPEYDQSDNLSIKLINVTGQEITTYKLSSNHSRIEINENIMPGIYFVKLINKDNLVGFKKINIVKR